jgi:hypothetical protein
MTTFGEFNVTPKTAMGAGILLFQSASGVFVALMSLARFITVLPNPPTRDDLETED